MKSNKLFSHIFLLALVIYSLWFISPLLTNSGFPQMGDSEYFLARMANYHLAFTQGQFPPRWAPNLNFSLGYPILNFPYPLPNIIGSLLITFGLTTINSLKFVFITSFFLATLGMYKLTTFLHSRLTAVISTIIYTTSPYFIINFYNRGSIGEILNFALVPWVILLTFSLLKTPSRSMQLKLTILLCFMFLAHNLTSLISAILLIGLIIAKTSHHKTRTITPLLLAMLITSFYWIPALGELQHTKASISPLNSIKLDQLIPISDLTTFTGDGTHKPVGPDIGISLQTGSAILLVTLVSAYFLIIHKPFRSNLIILLTLIIFISTLLITPISKPFWENVPIFGFIQFPWRLFFITTLLGSILTSFVISKANSKSLSVLLVALAFLNIASFSHPSQWFDKPDFFYVNYPLTSTAANEFDPLWFNSSKAQQYFNNSSTTVITTPPPKQLQIISDSGTKREYRLSVDQPTLVVEKTLYFPGWNTVTNGITQDLFTTRFDQAGLINYTLSPGNYLVKTTFSQRTLPRMLGNILTLIGILALLKLTFSKNQTSNLK